MKTDLEQVILRNILTNETYMRKVIPFVKKEYFEGTYRLLFNEVVRFVGNYNRIPNQEALTVEIQESDRFNENTYTEALDILPRIFQSGEENQQWLYDTTEKWCQDRAVYLAIMESITIIDGKHQSLSKNALPDILQ